MSSILVSILMSAYAQEGHYSYMAEKIIPLRDTYLQHGLDWWADDYYCKVVPPNAPPEEITQQGYRQLVNGEEAQADLLDDRISTLKTSVLNGHFSKIYARNLQLLNATLLREKQWEDYLLWKQWTQNSSTPATFFERGYAHFEMQKHDQAKSYFVKIIPGQPHYNDAQYYLAHLALREGNMPEAIDKLNKIKDQSGYEDHVPLLLAQIQYVRGNYDAVILLQPTARTHRNSIAQLYQIQGLSYIQQNNLTKGLSLFQQYVDMSSDITAQEYLLLGMGYFQLEKYAEAKSHLEKIAHLENAEGQLANYYLGDIYLLQGQKHDAKRAFLFASRLNDDDKVQSQSLFYYGKLSAELGYDKDALITLQDFGKTSIFYEEAQFLIGDILSNTPDYEQALITLEQLSPLSAPLRSVQHQLLYFKAVNLYMDGQTKSAIDLLLECSQRSDHPPTQVHSTLWLAEEQYRLDHLQESEELYQKTLALKGISPLQKEQALYSLGYIYLKQGDKENALNALNQVVTPTLNFYWDAQLKMADIYFSQRDYISALPIYHLAGEEFSETADYAIFQQAMISGLIQKPLEKLILLEDLIAAFPNSRYRDDAMMEAARTLLSLNEYKKALKEYIHLIETYGATSPYIEEALNQAGLVSYNLGATKEAIEFYQQVFDHYPNPEEKSTALIALEEIYVKELSRPDLFVDFVEKNNIAHVDRIREDSLAYAAGYHQLENGNVARATKIFEKYISDHPKGAYLEKAHYLLGEIYLNKEDFDRAQKAYCHACTINTGDFQSCYKCAELARHYKADFALALDSYEKAQINATTQEHIQKSTLGVMYSAFELGMDSLILQITNTILNSDEFNTSDQTFAHYARAKALINTGSALTSVNHLNQVIDQSAGEKAAECRYLIAKIYFDNDQLVLSEKLCDQANKRNTQSPIWLGKGLILYSRILVDLEQFLNARGALIAVINNFEATDPLHLEAQAELDRLDDFLNNKSKLKRDDQ